ncbi:MAG: hypothetical protein M0Z65_02735 [Firmicutes bacterium]|nr:hypothetical protein [Bacillota bacterium]
MTRYASLSLTRFAEGMAERKIPSPAAGSSLAATLMMACSLLELTVSEQVEKNSPSSGRNPHRDLNRLRHCRQEAESLVDADIEAVEAMIRGSESAEASRLLGPIRRLHELAGELLELAPDYLAVSGNKTSDTLVAFLQLRTVYLGTYHIACFNAATFGWEPLFTPEWEKQLQQTDHQIQKSLRSVEARAKRNHLS